MKTEFEERLQKNFPFMWQKHEEGYDPYRRWGCECSDGWYLLIRDACQAIADKYKEAEIDIDFVPLQIKEKLGTLRFYYGFTDDPYGIVAIDNIASGTSLKFAPESKDVDAKKRAFRDEIAEIVRAAEKKSGYTCEICGAETGKLRNDISLGIRRIQTLCDDCNEKRMRVYNENRERRKNMTPKDIF